MGIKGNSLKVISIIILTTLTFSNATYANIATPPRYCPHTTAIKLMGVSHNAFKDASGTWVTGRKYQYYNTHHAWSLVMWGIVANSQSQAFDRATKALTSLKYKSGPTAIDSEHYTCTYTNREGFWTQVVTPSLE